MTAQKSDRAGATADRMTTGETPAMTSIESHDAWLDNMAERHVDPPATCDHCRSVVAHASELTEVAADRYVCDDCQRDNAEPFSCDGCGLSVPEFLITNTTYIGSDCSMCPDCTGRADQ